MIANASVTSLRRLFRSVGMLYSHRRNTQQSGGRRGIITFIKIFHVLFALLICALLIAVTDAHRGNDPWSNLQKWNLPWHKLYPLDVEGSYRPSPYPDGSIVDGLIWTPNKVDVRVNLNNPTTKDYTDLDLYLSTHQFIWDMVQVTNIPSTTYAGIDVNGIIDGYAEGTEERGEKIVLPNVKVAHQCHSYHVSCAKLPRMTRMRLALVVAAINPSINGRAPLQFFSARTIPKSVTIKGEYKVDGSIKLLDMHMPPWK